MAASTRAAAIVADAPNSSNAAAVRAELENAIRAVDQLSETNPMSRSPANYLTRDLLTESKRKSSHHLPTTARSSSTAADATAALHYARYLRSLRFQEEMNAKRRKSGIATREVSSAGMPLGNSGKIVYERVRQELGNMARFGQDVEHRAIIERLIEMGAKP